MPLACGLTQAASKAAAARNGRPTKRPLRRKYTIDLVSSPSTRIATDQPIFMARALGHQPMWTHSR